MQHNFSESVDEKKMKNIGAGKKSSLQRHTTVRIKNRNVWGWKSAFVKIKMTGMMIETTVVYATDFSRRGGGEAAEHRGSMFWGSHQRECCLNEEC